MGWLRDAFEFFLHLDVHVRELITTHGSTTYLILFLIIFAETGLVICPFLPGDSLLFAVGIFTHADPARPNDAHLNVYTVFVLLSLAAFAGDNLNYWIGKSVGPKIFREERARFFKRSHLDRTHAFFETYGLKAIILARFVPIVRTMMPFVAGIGKMTYATFLIYSAFAAVLWVGICVFAGHFFGRIQLVRDNFGIGILAIVAISIIPMAVEYIKHRKRRNLSKTKPSDSV